MERTRPLRSDDSMLLLGRLDGRLQSSPCVDIFLARSRLEGAVELAGLAGVPIKLSDLHDWIAGRSPPPRATEGLNDPMSVAAIFHVALSRDEDTNDPVHRATLKVLRVILDDRVEVQTYGSDDLAHLGPLWRQIRAAANTPFTSGDLLEISSRVFELGELTEQSARMGSDVVSIDGRTWELLPRQRDRNWLIATAVPMMLQQAGFTTRVIPSLVLLPKFLPPSPAELAGLLSERLAAAARAGLRDLDVIERAAARLASDRPVTKRSKSPLLRRLQIAYPGLQASAVSRLLGVTPQGARKLLAASPR